MENVSQDQIQSWIMAACSAAGTLFGIMAWVRARRVGRSNRIEQIPCPDGTVLTVLNGEVVQTSGPLPYPSTTSPATRGIPVSTQADSSRPEAKSAPRARRPLPELRYVLGGIFAAVGVALLLDGVAMGHLAAFKVFDLDPWAILSPLILGGLSVGASYISRYAKQNA